VLNSSFVKLISGKPVRYDTDKEDTTSPQNNQAGWRHAIAVDHGRILEKEFAMSTKWLWIRGANRPDPDRGYMYKVLKVYRISECASPGTGCKGACVTGDGGPTAKRRKAK
jgi:hypothetical protein